MTIEARRGSAALAGVGRWVPWVAFATAFAPALGSLGRFFWAGEVPIDRAPLVGAVLFVWSVGSTRSDAQPGRRDGALLLFGACVLELVGISTDSWSIAHLAIPMGTIGLARFLGSPPLLTAALSLFAVPLPFFMTAALSPDLEASFASVASGIAQVAGLRVDSTVWTIDGPGGGIDLMPADGGLALAHLMAGIGWFSGVRGGADLTRCTKSALVSGLAAFPVQLAAMVAAAAAIGAGTPALGLFLLRDALWPLMALGGIAAALRGPRAGPEPGRL